MKTKLLRELQSRIDRRANHIAWLESEIAKGEDNYWLYDQLEEIVVERDEQTLDKRLMAHIIELRGNCGLQN